MVCRVTCRRRHHRHHHRHQLLQLWRINRLHGCYRGSQRRIDLAISLTDENMAAWPGGRSSSHTHTSTCLLWSLWGKMVAQQAYTCKKKKKNILSIRKTCSSPEAISHFSHVTCNGKQSQIQQQILGKTTEEFAVQPHRRRFRYVQAGNWKLLHLKVFTGWINIEWLLRKNAEHTVSTNK